MGHIAQFWGNEQPVVNVGNHVLDYHVSLGYK